MNKKITSIITSALLISQNLLVVPAVSAATTLEISGNGADSTSQVQLNQTNSTNVVQSNNAQINNNVKVDADTGDNDANKNTGGDVNVKTGDADVAVAVQNMANQNSVDLDNCGNCSGDVDVLISENGADSVNTAAVNKASQTRVFQQNNADIDNKIDAEAETGDNEANKNTGGDVSIETGDATTTVGVTTEANKNSAKVGGAGSGSSLSARILGNGANSVNQMQLGLANLLDLVQSNSADVYNDIKAEAETGDNEAEKNTGGVVMIETGDADVLVGIDNKVNFNYADLDCGCFLEDVMAKIAGNGTDSENIIAAQLGDALGVFQDNCGDIAPGQAGILEERDGECELDNKVDAEAETGENDADENTGDYAGDPSIETGDSDATVFIENEGYVNTVGSDSSDIDFGGTGIEFDFHLDLSDLLALLGL